MLVRLLSQLPAQLRDDIQYRRWAGTSVVSDGDNGDGGQASMCHGKYTYLIDEIIFDPRPGKMLHSSISNR